MVSLASIDARSPSSNWLLPRVFVTWEQRRHLLVLILLCVLRTVVADIVDYEQGRAEANMTLSLETKDSERFAYALRWHLLLQPVGMVLGTIMIKYTVCKLSAALQLANMQALTQGLYSSQESGAPPFYRLQFVEGGKTPEFQLIQDSVDYGHAFVAVVETIAGVLTAPLFFQEAIELNAARAFSCFGMCLLATVLQAVAWGVACGEISWMIWEKVNNVRSVLTRVLSNVEAIALFRGGDAEMKRIRQVHSMVWSTRLSWARRMSCLVAFGLLLAVAFSVWPALSIIQELLDGRTKFATVQRFISVMGASLRRLGDLAKLPATYTNMAINKSRILSILQETERIHAEAARLKRTTEKREQSEEFIVLYESDVQDGRPALELRDVTLRKPAVQDTQGAVLIEGLSLSMAVGDSLLIVGDSGVGKSSLLSAIAGVWSAGRGEIQRCRRSGVLCLPQRPFMFMGSLREQLLYPNVDDDKVSDDALWGVLMQLNLERHLRGHGLDKVCSWADVLSPGQQQRIGVARALLAAGRVRLLLLDETTSALDLQNEQVVYEALLQCRPHCLVSVGHRPSVRRYHKRVLTLTAQEAEDGGTYTRHAVSTLKPAPPAAKVAAAAESQGSESPSSMWEREEPANGGDAERSLSWLPEPYRTVVDCVETIWVPLKNSDRNVLKDSMRNVCFGMASTVLVVFFSLVSYQIGLDFVEALTERLEERAYSHFKWIVLMALVPICITPVIVFNYTTVFSCNAERLRLFLLERFLGGPDAAYYSMRLQGGLHDDNPADIITGADCDQVIWTLMFVTTAFSGIIGIISSVVRLFVWSPTMSVALLVPTVLVGVPLSIRSMQLVLRHWMDATGLRAAICVRVAHARENAEAVALLKGGPAEKRHLDRMSAKFVTSKMSVHCVNMDLGIIISLLTHAIFAINHFTAGFDVIKGNIKIAEYYDNGMMINLALGIVQVAKKLCGESAMPNFVSCRRVRELVTRINSAKEAANSGGILLQEPADRKIVLEMRCVSLTPMQSARSRLQQQQILLARVSARLWEGESLLIVGESGLGKSSLLRAMAGICTSGSGEIYCPRKEDVMFFAQRPYLCFGTLREQLLYPHAERQVEDRQLKEALKAVDLEHLLESPGLGLDATTPEETEKALHESQRWTSQLSLGEIQRLGFARLLLREGVRLTLFDEGTSALDLTHEAALYSLLSGHTRSYVSVAHRPQLYQWHSHILVLEQNLQGQALAVARFSDMVHFRKELEIFGAHPSDNAIALRRVLASERAAMSAGQRA